jgi:O-antigen ligase
LLSWLGVVVVHGVLIVAQFLSTDVFRVTADFAANFGALDCCRPSGLFENANSTALFQTMGFAPLLLVRPSKPVALILGALILISIIATGSLAAMAGFLVGLTLAIIAISIAGGGLHHFIRVFGQLVLATALLGGLFYFIIAQNPDLSARLAAVSYGRATGSAEVRFSLWERGIDLLGSEKLVWGIGPDAYKDLDLLQKPLHNDLLAFLVERGIIGTLGLVLLAVLAVSKAIRLVRISKKQAAVGLSAVICLAALAAALVNGQFHQIFHDRSVWLLLAVQEAVLVRMTTFEQGRPPAGLQNQPDLVHTQVARR